MTYSITACAPYLAAPNEPNSSLVIGRVVVENNYAGAFFGLLPLGKLDKGLEVGIESRDGKQSFKVSTEEQGYFIIPNIGPGNYHILNVVIEGWRGGGDKERYGITVRRPTFAPTPGKITYIGTLVIAVSDRGTSKIQEIKEPESASAYFRQKNAASAWVNREFVRSGQPLQATAAYPSGKIEKPEWKIGFEWRYAWKQAGRSGTFINEIVREEVFDGKPAYVVRNGNNEDYYVKDVLGMLARRSRGTVIFKRSEPRQNFLWPLEVGKEWTNSYLRENVQSKTSETFAYKMVVARIEEITVPAGTFQTHKVEVFLSRTGKLSAEYWYAPNVKSPVKEKEYLQNGLREVELVSFKID